MDAHKVGYLLHRKRVHSEVSFQILLKNKTGVIQLGKSRRKKFKLVLSLAQRVLRFLLTACHSDRLSLHLLLKLRHRGSKCRLWEGLGTLSEWIMWDLH